MDKILQWFGDRANRDIKRARDFWNGKGRFIISINNKEPGYRQLEDLDLLAKNGILSLEAQSRLPGCNVPILTIDLGTATSAAYWGGKVRRDSTGINISIDAAADTIEAAAEIKPFKIDDPKMDAYKIIKLYRDVCRTLNTDKLWLRAGDVQGTLSTASLIVEQENFLMELFTNPKPAHKLLNTVSDLLIEYIRYVRRETNGMIAGPMWPYIYFPADLGFGITEDMMPLVSADMYKEFGIPYLKKMSENLGPVQIHCCGNYIHQVENLVESGINIRAIEFHYPFMDYKALKPLAEKGVAFIPFINIDKANGEFTSDIEFYQYLLDKTDYRFWFAFCEENEPAIQFAKENGF
jgi:hypothetical protein